MQPEITTVEYSICTDCLQYIEYACETGEDPIIDQAIEREVAGKDANFVAGVAPTEDDENGTGYEEFSSRSCELCGSGLAGSRYGATLVIREGKP